MYTCHVCARAWGFQKEELDSPWHGYWELTLDPLSEQQGLLDAGPPLWFSPFLSSFLKILQRTFSISHSHPVVGLCLLRERWHSAIRMSLAACLLPVMLGEHMAFTSCLSSLSLQLPCLPKQLLVHKSYPHFVLDPFSSLFVFVLQYWCTALCPVHVRQVFYYCATFSAFCESRYP